MRMLTRRDTLALGASATVAILSGAGRASTSPETRQIPTLQTRLFNFKDEASPDTQAEIISRLRSSMQSPGIDSFLIGRNFIPTPFASRFEWIYVVQRADLAAPEARAAWYDFDLATMMLASHCRNAVECDLGSSFPAKFANGAGVKVRHTVMFDFKPDASPEARARNIAAIRGMGALPMIQRYVVEQSAGDASDPTQMQWQVIGDFGSVDDYRAYSQAPVHLAIRDDFKAHTSRVAFLDVEL